MNEVERKKLLAHTGEYISIGITDSGKAMGSIWVPWERTAHAFNMRTPNVYFSREDVESGEAFRLISSFTLIGCYIFAPLSSYAFLSDFATLRDVFIAEGSTLTDLSFMVALSECRMLYVRGAHIKDLSPLPKEPGCSGFMYLSCLAFDNCVIEDNSALLGWDHFFSELIIWEAEGIHERTKWDVKRTMVFRYHESGSGNTSPKPLSKEDEATLLDYIEKKINRKK